MSDNVSVTELWERLDKFEERINTRYVSKAELLPIKLLVYGAVATILTKVVGTGLGFIAANTDIIKVMAQGF